MMPCGVYSAYSTESGNPRWIQIMGEVLVPFAIGPVNSLGRQTSIEEEVERRRASTIYCVNLTAAA